MRCRVGDLCVVVSAKLTPEMLNRFVVVERPANPSEYVDTGDGYAWIVRSASGADLPIRYVNKRTLKPTGQITWGRSRPYGDAALFPLRDNDGTDETIVLAGTPKQRARKQMAALTQELDGAFKRLEEETKGRA